MSGEFVRQLAELEAERDRLVRLVERLEWCPMNVDGEPFLICPLCAATRLTLQDDGRHRADCDLGNFLAEERA